MAPRRRNGSSGRRRSKRFAVDSVPLRAAALQFPLAHPAIDVVIAGAQVPEHWEDAVNMLAHPIPGAFWRRLKADHLLPDEAPVPVD